jgi:hypothetical protein
MVNDNEIQSDLRRTLNEFVEDAVHYFDEAEGALGTGYDWIGFDRNDKEFYWKDLSKSFQDEAKSLIDRLVLFASQVTTVLKTSPLSSDSDQQDLLISIKEMRATLLLRYFTHWDIDVLHNEGEILGIRPAGQSDDRPLKPSDAKQKFISSSEQIVEIIRLAEAGNSLDSPSYNNRLSPSANSVRYRRGTAFIMMWMNPGNPELDDIHDTVVEVFRQFKIRAIRADDIEHEGIITERVLREIETSEFLFADLTGQRPNVYYEVGYAHALKKSVILYRKEEEVMHFDLAGYNCPTYRNQRHLRQLLTRRLEAITNKSVESYDDIE